MGLPPTVDVAIRLVHKQLGKSTVAELADAVIAHGWDVDREALVARIRELFPPRVARAEPAHAPAAPNRVPEKKVKPGKGEAGSAKKKPKTRFWQDYCPKCHVFVLMTRQSGVTKIAEHLTKRGVPCGLAGRTPPPKKKERKRDALDFRVAGSYGTGKRR